MLKQKDRPLLLLILQTDYQTDDKDQGANMPTWIRKVKSWSILTSFLTQVIEEPTRKGALLDLIHTHKAEKVSNAKIKASFGYSDHKMVCRVQDSKRREQGKK